MSFQSAPSLEARCDSLLLGRLGSELALIYHDTFRAPLPPALQSLIDRLPNGTIASRDEAGHSGSAR